MVTFLNSEPEEFHFCYLSSSYVVSSLLIIVIIMLSQQTTTGFCKQFLQYFYYSFNPAFNKWMFYKKNNLINYCCDLLLIVDKAPVCKGLLGCMFLTCTAIHVPMIAHLRQYLACQIPQVLISGHIWRLLFNRLTYIHTKDLICSALVIYYFR